MTGGRPQVRFGLPTVAASTDEGGGDDFLKIPGAIRRVKAPAIFFPPHGLDGCVRLSGCLVS